MNTTVEIEIPDEIIIKAAQEIGWAMFQKPNWGNQEGPGTALIRKQMEGIVAQLDLRSMVRDTVERMAQKTVEELVREKLRKLSRDELKKLLDSPALI